MRAGVTQNQQWEETKVTWSRTAIALLTTIISSVATATSYWTKTLPSLIQSCQENLGGAVLLPLRSIPKMAGLY